MRTTLHTRRGPTCIAVSAESTKHAGRTAARWNSHGERVASRAGTQDKLSIGHACRVFTECLTTEAAPWERAAPPPRRLVSWLMTRPAELPGHDRRHLEDLMASCPHLTVLAENERLASEGMRVLDAPA